MLDRESGTFVNYFVEQGKKNSLGESNINALLVSRDGRIWLGTNAGLHVMEEEKSREVGEGSMTKLAISGLVEDLSGQIWIATSNGLFQLDTFCLFIPNCLWAFHINFFF